MILVDVSGSMAVIDPGQTLSRLDRMKASLREAIRSPSLAPSDSIGLVLISEIPRVACPSTTDRESLMAIVDSLEVDPLRDRTNLGDAIALALDSLQKSGGRDGGILIYSDGAHNVAEGLSRREAARIAQALNVPISAVPLAAEDNDDADIAALRHVCEMTGGTFYSAADSQTESAGDRMPTFLGESPSREEQLWLWSDLFPQCLLAALAVLVVERLARWVIVRPL